MHRYGLADGAHFVVCCCVLLVHFLLLSPGVAFLFLPFYPRTAQTPTHVESARRNSAHPVVPSKGSVPRVRRGSYTKAGAPPLPTLDAVVSAGGDAEGATGSSSHTGGVLRTVTPTPFVFQPPENVTVATVKRVELQHPQVGRATAAMCCVSCVAPQQLT